MNTKLKKIIIIDDDMVDHFYYQNIDKEKIEILGIYRNSDEFFKVYKEKEKDVDIVLIDVYLHNSPLDGWQIFKRLENENYEASKVLISNDASISARTILQAREHGLNGFIMKLVIAEENVNLTEYLLKIRPDKYVSEPQTAAKVMEAPDNEIKKIWNNLYDIAIFLHYILWAKKNSINVEEEKMIRNYSNLVEEASKKNYYFDKNFAHYIDYVNINDENKKLLQCLLFIALNKSTEDIDKLVYADEMKEWVRTRQKGTTIEEFFKNANKTQVIEYKNYVRNLFDRKKVDIRKIFSLDPIITQINIEDERITKDIILKAFIIKFLNLRR